MAGQVAWPIASKNVSHTKSRSFANVHSARLHSFGVSRSACVRTATHADSPRSEAYTWVNTRSGKYWKSGSRFYGKTKEGEFMSESEAISRGYSPAVGTAQ